MKRALDIVLGMLLVLITLPTMIVLAIGVALMLRAWPLFIQHRVGRDGRVFRFPKLRTLPPDTPAYASKYEISELSLPWFARLLRRTHLDELPQLFLVPTGRMSLVGPRPEMPTLHATFDSEFARLRTSVRPGCTGLWQIGRGINGLIRESPEYDAFYIRRWSLRMDLWILWRTVATVLGWVRPIEPWDVPVGLWGSGLGVAVSPALTVATEPDDQVLEPVVAGATAA